MKKINKLIKQETAKSQEPFAYIEEEKGSAEEYVTSFCQFNLRKLKIKAQETKIKNKNKK